MPQINLYSHDDHTVRTQITLTASLKKVMEEKAGVLGVSLSEYIRQAAIIKILLETQENQDLAGLAKRAVTSISLKDHPDWQNEKKINKWIKNLRNTWD